MDFSITIFLILLDIYYLFLIAGVFLSWLPMLYNFRFFRFVKKVGDWYMEPFHGIVVLGPLDFTPIFGFILYDLLLKLIYSLI